MFHDERVNINPVRFRAAVAVARLSGRELSRRLGVGSSTLARWGRGIMRAPVGAVEQIEEWLRVSPGWLSGADESEPGR